MDLIIEKLKKEDLKEAVEIYDKNHMTKTNYHKLLEVYDDIDQNEAYHNIVAKMDGKIVGLATLIIHYDIVEDLKPFLTVWNVGVHKDYQRQKIGTKMFEYIEQYAREHHCDFINLTAEMKNKTAQSFYESMGYKKEVGYLKLIDKEQW